MQVRFTAIPLVLLAALLLGNLVNVLGEAIEVLLLLGQLLPELEQLFLFALADGVVLGGLFAALEGVALAAGLGGSASVAFAHGAGSGGECGAEGTESGRLGEGCAEHFGVDLSGWSGLGGWCCCWKEVK